MQLNRGNTVYVCLYVDDMNFAVNTSEEIASVKNALQGSFKMKDLGTTKVILGMEVKHESRDKILAI